jgi:hypothetical protein
MMPHEPAARPLTAQAAADRRRSGHENNDFWSAYGTTADLADQAGQGTCRDEIEIIIREDRRMKGMSVALVWPAC